MNQLETLLNTLIARGWKPWGKGYTAIDIAQDGRDECLMFWNVPKRQMKAYTLRDLVSLESGLWQFVCSHLLIGPNKSDWMKNADIGSDGYITSNEYYTALNHQYRLLESALVPEEELGKFLVDNIIVEGLKSEQSKR